MARLPRPSVGELLVALAAVAALVLARARRAARRLRLSPLTARFRVGPEFLDRRGVVGEELVGEMDDMAEFARPDFDPDAVHPEVRRFYERTADFEMRYRVRWHPGFRLGAALASRLTSRIEQLNLPGPGDEHRWRRLRSRIVRVDAAADPRPAARAWIRTDPETGEAVFVAVYAVRDAGPADAPTDERERHVDIAVPLPGSNLSTVLRPEHLDDAPTDGGLRLTTRAAGDPGLYLVTALGAFRLPLAQTFRVWPAEGGTARLAATHEMRVFDRQFLTVEYDIERVAGAASDGEQ